MPETGGTQWNRWVLLGGRAGVPKACGILGCGGIQGITWGCGLTKGVDGRDAGDWGGGGVATQGSN